MRARTAIDLFSGCGGLSQGLRGAGFEVIACAEIRPEARATYGLNHPNTVLYEDIRTLDGNDILDIRKLKQGDLDLLAACPPCQGFSSMRTKNGAIAEDPRNELIFQVLRLVKELIPKCILIENVPRLLQDDRLQKFKTELEAVGYQFSEGVLDAKNFSVPQRRKRMILIGSKYGQFGLPESAKKARTVGDVLRALPLPEGKHKLPLHRLKQKLSPLVLQRIQRIKSNRSELPADLALPCHTRYPNGFRDVYGRMAWDEVAPTITRSSHNPSKGRYVHPEQHRGITLYESMLLQGFPKSYKFPSYLGIGKISSMIGEAFPPPMALAQAKLIMERLDFFESV